MGTKRYELTESEWLRIREMLPPEHPKGGKRGRPAKCDNRSAMNGILWIARGGAPWRELPERYGPWQTVYSRGPVDKSKNSAETHSGPSRIVNLEIEKDGIYHPIKV